MATKITELTAATSVKTTDVVPVVDLTAGTTKKATARQVVEGCDGIVATLTGSTFTGPIVASSTGGITGSITQLVGGAPFITALPGNVITITTGSGGQIIFSGSGGTATGGSAASISAQYLQLATDATNTAERVFTPSTGLKATDAGANGAYTVIVHDGTFAALTGSVFTGVISGSGGISGSIQQVGPGLSYLVGSTGINVTSASNGQVSFAINNGVVATISGSTFTGPVVGASNGGFTGSLTQLVGGTPFITAPAGNIITVSTGSAGQIVLSGSADGNGAPASSQYLALATDAGLSAERVFTPSTGLKATDAGANGAYTVIVHDGTFAALTGSNFTGVVQCSSPAATLGSDVFTYFSGSCGLTGSSVNTPATRKVTLIGGDLMLSGTLSEQRPTQAPKAYFLQYNSQSVISAVGPTVIYAIDCVPSGAFKVSVEAAATHATPSTGAGGFSCWSAFVNNLGVVTQLGAIGGVTTGTFGGAGASAWSLALDASNNKVRLLVSGSAATSTWAWWLTAVGSSP